MKTKLLILIIAFGFQTVFAQSEKEISAIRNEVNAINKNLKSYTKKTKDIEEISTEGAEATFYSSGKGLKKISAKIYGETFNATGDFYYQGEELIFAFFKFNRYDTQIGLEKPPKVVKTEENRLYFAGGNLVRLMIGKKILKSTDEKYKETRDDIVELAGKLKAAF